MTPSALETTSLEYSTYRKNAREADRTDVGISRMYSYVVYLDRFLYVSHSLVFAVR